MWSRVGAFHHDLAVAQCWLAGKEHPGKRPTAQRLNQVPIQPGIARFRPVHPRFHPSVYGEHAGQRVLHGREIRQKLLGVDLLPCFLAKTVFLVSQIDHQIMSRLDLRMPLDESPGVRQLSLLPVIDRV